MYSCDSEISFWTRADSHSIFFGYNLTIGRIHRTCSPLVTFHRGGPGMRPDTTTSSSSSAILVSCIWAGTADWSSGAANNATDLSALAARRMDDTPYTSL